MVTIKCVTCKLGDAAFYITVVHVDLNRYQGPLDLLLNQVIERDFCLFKVKWTISECLLIVVSFPCLSYLILKLQERRRTNDKLFFPISSSG